MKRIVVQEGRRTSEGETPSGAVTPATQEADDAATEKPRTVEEEHRTAAGDLEKGSNESEDGTVEHEKAGAS